MAPNSDHSTFQPTRFQLWLVRLCVIAFWGAYSYGAFSSADATLQPDLQVYLGAAKAFLVKDPVYGEEFPVEIGIIERTWEGPFLYPPPFVVATSALAPFASEDLRVLVTISSLLLLIVCSVVVVAILEQQNLGLRLSREFRFDLVLVLTALFGPVWTGMYFGQVHLLVYALLVVFVWTLLRGQDLWAGSTLALAALIKVTPVLLLLYPLLCRRWHLLATFAVVGFALSGVSLLVPNGFALWRDFLFTGLEVGAGEHFGNYGGNYSLVALLPQLLGISTKVFTPLLVLVVVSIFTCVLWRLANTRAFVAGALVNLALLVLISPILWSHHTVWFLPVLFWIILFGISTASRKWLGIGVALYAALSLYDNTAVVFVLIAADGEVPMLTRLIPGLLMIAALAVFLRKTAPSAPKRSG